MGLFGKTKAKKNVLNTWIAMVDAAYTRAFETMDISDVSQFMSRELAMKVFETVRRGEKEYSGLSRYRNIAWKRESEKNDKIQMLKIVTYDHIKVTRGIIASVGSDYKERWTIDRHGDDFMVTDIRRVS